MRRKIIYGLVGFDRQTQRLAERHPMPPSRAHEVKQIAAAGDKNDNELGDWELTEPQINGIYFLAPGIADPSLRSTPARTSALVR